MLTYASSDGHTAGDTDTYLAVSHTVVAGSNIFMVVGIMFNPDDDERVSTVHWNTTEELDKIGEIVRSDDSMVYIYKLVSPTTGTHDVDIVFNANLNDGAHAAIITFAGVDLDDPHSAFAHDNDSDTTSANTGSITSATDETIIAFCHCKYDAINNPSPGDELYAGSPDSKCNYAVAIDDGTSPYTMTWNLVNDPTPYNHWAAAGISIKPAEEAPVGIAGYDFGERLAANEYNFGDRTLTSGVAEQPGEGSAISLLNTKFVNNEDSSEAVTLTAGTNRMMVIALTYEGQDSSATISYNGTGMTNAAGYHQAASFGAGVIYYILKEADFPAQGNAVVSTTNTGYSMTIWLLDSVKQNENYYDFDYDTATTNQTDSTTPDINVDVDGILLSATAVGGGGSTFDLTGTWQHENDLTGLSYEGISGDRLTTSSGTDNSDWNATGSTFRHSHCVISFRSDNEEAEGTPAIPAKYGYELGKRTEL